MFLMPMALVFIVTLVQDSTFKSVNETSVPLLFVDNDKDSLSFQLENSLTQAHFFTTSKKNISVDEAKQLVATGKFLMAVIVPENISKKLRNKAKAKISKAFNPNDSIINDDSELQLQLFFDPITKQSFKVTISSAIDKIVSGIEMQSLTKELSQQLKQNFPNAKPIAFDSKPLVTTIQQYASTNETSLVPNSVQHNVPAWTMFAMFFICIPLSANIIRERDDGSAFRLLTMSGSYLNVLMGKILIYLLVNLIQFVLMLCVGIYFLPMLGLPQLQIGNNFFTLLVVALSSGLAACGFGLLVGTIAGSVDQAALFGAVSIVILAALGGVWIPTFVMPEFMRKISSISPLNWGLEAFYGVFVRGLSLGGIFIYLLKLKLFFVACVSGAFYYQVYRRMR